MINFFPNIFGLIALPSRLISTFISDTLIELFFSCNIQQKVLHKQNFKIKHKVNLKGRLLNNKNEIIHRLGCGRLLKGNGRKVRVCDDEIISLPIDTNKEKYKSYLKDLYKSRVERLCFIETKFLKTIYFLLTFIIFTFLAIVFIIFIKNKLFIHVPILKLEAFQAASCVLINLIAMHAFCALCFELMNFNFLFKRKEVCDNEKVSNKRIGNSFSPIYVKKKAKLDCLKLLVEEKSYNNKKLKNDDEIKYDLNSAKLEVKDNQPVIILNLKSSKKSKEFSVKKGYIPDEEPYIFIEVNYIEIEDKKYEIKKIPKDKILKVSLHEKNNIEEKIFLQGNGGMQSYFFSNEDYGDIVKYQKGDFYIIKIEFSNMELALKKRNNGHFMRFRIEKKEKDQLYVNSPFLLGKCYLKVEKQEVTNEVVLVLTRNEKEFHEQNCPVFTDND